MSTASPVPDAIAETRPAPTRLHTGALESDEYFAYQPSPRSVLPGPVPLLENLTRCVIEILAGARDLEQISRWVTDDVSR